jgi:anti-sigma B factor antagonist
MHLEHVTGDGSAVGRAASRGGRYADSRSSRAVLELARLEKPGRGRAAAADGREPRAAGEFVVRIEHRADAVIVWLSGALDRATSALLDRELDAQAGRPMPVVIDLTGLEFVDSSGLDTLVRIHQRAGESGEKLCFRQGRHVAQRPLELIRNVRRRSRSASRCARVTIEDSYFALAMACADVDHSRPGDRLWGTIYRFPDQAAGASDAAPPPGVARAAPPCARLEQPHNGIRPSV